MANLTRRRAVIVGLVLGMVVAVIVFVAFAYVALSQLIDGLKIER